MSNAPLPDNLSDNTPIIVGAGQYVERELGESTPMSLAIKASQNALADAGIEGKQPRYRLAPQPTVAKFFLEQIQLPGAVEKPADEFGLSEVEGNILHNRIRLEERLDELLDNKHDLASVAGFLLTRCLLVLEVVDGESENEAWKMLQTEENTGLPFHHCDRVKVTLIEAMPPAEREDAGKMWEKCQAKLGGDGMQQLIGHVPGFIL